MCMCFLLYKLFIIFYIFSSVTVTEAEEYENEIYTDMEKIALQKFRVIVNDSIVREYETHDTFLINWLRANKLNLNEAAQMFVQAQRWRINNHIDTITNETIIYLNPPVYIIDGFDKKSHPIVIITPTHVDGRRLLIQGGRDKLVRMFYQLLERGFIKTREASKIFHKDINKVTYILDLHGLNLRQHLCLSCLSVYRDWFITLEKYYPELAEHVIVINVPRLAMPLIEIIRPILSQNSRRAFQLFPPDQREWTKFLHEIISDDQLPKIYGGKRGTK